MKIGIIVAMDSEFESIKNILYKSTINVINKKTFLVGSYKGKHTLIVSISGIGKVNASSTATLMINKYHPDMIINTGCAGGITDNFKVGDILLGAVYKYHDVWCPVSPDTKYGQIQGSPAEFKCTADTIPVDATKWIPHYTGIIYTGDRFIQTREECQKILDLFPDDKRNSYAACDMESAAIAQICHIHNVKFISFRVISDVPARQNNAEDHMNEYENFWGSMSNKSYEFLKMFIESIY